MPPDARHRSGNCPTGALFRPLASASRAELAGRTVWTLSNERDGFGDATISLARIATGSMNAHAHWPGGEFMFVAGGRGRVWIEGISLGLERGSSSYIPPGLLHNAENTQAGDLVILGITAPGVVPGSYAEIPPLFTATGKIDSVEACSCSVSPDEAPAGATAKRLIPSTDEGLSVRVRLLTVAPKQTVGLGGPTDRAWVSIGGAGTLACGENGTHRLGRYSVCLAGPGTRLYLTAGPIGLTLLEVAHAAPPG